MIDRSKTLFFFTKYRLYNNKAIHFFNELLKNQNLSLSEIDKINLCKRKKLLSYAYYHVPFYRERFKSAGLHPEDIKQPEDYAGVPLLTRDDLRTHFDALFAEHIDRKLLRPSTTGGSTGQPVKVMFDKRVPLEAVGWRFYSWLGISPGLNSALIWRDMRTKFLSRAINQLLWWPALRITLDASSVAPEDITLFVKRFNRIEPRILHSYVGTLDYVASFIEHNNLSVFSPKAISVTSSPISAVQRCRIERVFQCPVYDQYGTCEVFWLASQCGEKNYLHRYHDIRHIEFTDDTGQNVPDGEMGNIVVTDLENYGFPLIRYVNGDMGRAVSEKCPCGVNLPLMDQVKGRIIDLIKLPDGSTLAGMTAIFDVFPEVVSGFQVHQTKDYSIKIIYIPNKSASGLDNALVSVLNNLKTRTRSLVKISMQPVESISSHKGKLRFVISDVE